MADRKKKPFVKKPNVGRPFDKQGKLADAIRALSGKKMPFDKSLKMAEGGRVSDRDKMKMEKMARPKKTGMATGKAVSDADVKKVAAMLEKPKKRKTDRQLMQFQDGGAVPAEFKGFSKLPEKVQQKMNPDLAQKYENGGEVRGAGSAISGRGFKGIR
tara:strand:+ start:404 stop:877 length:474 start_codon:yes stop_codon:yes gene_type:complete